MQHFSIDKKNEVDKTFRVSKIMADFDVDPKHSNEHFEGDFDLPEEWNVGIIVGKSGTGKTTIAKDMFGEELISGLKYNHKSVIDDMPKDKNVEEISKAFYSVGFGSVPSWLKPYAVLSNGEKMRVDIARSILEKDFIVFDEFTSVVDREVAKVASMAVSKAIRKQNKKFIAVTCHYDVIDYLEPDWVFNTDTMTFSFMTGDDLNKRSQLGNAIDLNGKNLGSIII
ncbi:ABC transporter ATP-binding protein [Ligilactobacillus salivarius]|uniref:ATP-binding cassette domain-containing protein n=1 Tax=Ligilactobacillus salivarius TaxID=1624 RepID=UPI001785CFDB|nr:ABC transporter ATP-binding protein [Ligilactobacillus salivarius]QXL48865.1 ABC transporter ATP-binding protein [Ligilactobacillus salivarius]